jgi:lambda family phage portal protein
MTQKLSLVARMGAGIKAFGAGFGAGISTFQPYEGAGFSRKRPVIYGAHARDSRLDLNEATRTELLKLARHMYRNVGLIKGAVDSIATYSIGPGLRPQYRGTDQEFGRLCEEYWRDMVAPSPEVTGRMTWTDMLLALSRSIDVDGDVFVVMTEKGKLQIVEGHRVCEGDDYGTADGVFLGKLGEPTAYLVQTGELYRKLSAETVIHLMELERPDQIRGGSSLARALNHVRDLKMLGEFEKDALKLQGSIAAVITTDQGDELAGQGGFFGTVQAQDTGEPTIAREEITSSATIPRLSPGEKIEMIGPNRPHAGFEPFAKFLIRDVAMGLGLPVEFVYDPASVGGAGMRFIVAKAQRRFEQRQRLLIDRFCNRAWRFFIGGAIANGDLPAAEDYAKVTWQTPKSLTVDAGREAQQAREDYKAGLSSLQDYFGELGQDWEEQVRQIAKEREFIASIGTVTPQTDVAAPAEAVKEAPAIDEPTPVNPEKDPNAGPDAELSAVVALNMPDPTPGENEDAFMDRCMTETSMIKEYPDQDKRQTACKLRFTSKTELNMPDPTPSENEDAYMDRCMTDRAMVKEYPDQDKRQVACKLRFTAKTELNMPDPTLGESEDAFMDRCMTETSMIKEYPDQDKRQVACKLRFTSKTNLSAKPETEAFIMKDDPDFNLSAKELDMVAKAVGLKDKKPRTIKKK